MWVILIQLPSPKEQVVQYDPAMTNQLVNFFMAQLAFDIWSSLIIGALLEILEQLVSPRVDAEKSHDWGVAAEHPSNPSGGLSFPNRTVL